MLGAGPRLTGKENNLKKNNTSMGNKWEKVDTFERSPEKPPSSAVEFIILFVFALLDCLDMLNRTSTDQIAICSIALLCTNHNQHDYPNLPSRPLGM